MWNLVSLALLFLAGAVLYALRNRIGAAFRRFEARNAQRRADEVRALMDRYAHYRHTVQFADEQIEDVSKVTVPDERTGEPVTRYLFLGAYYASQKDAEAAPHDMVVEKAREFYVDLDRIYLSRRGRPAPPFAGPLLTDPSKHETYTPPRG